MAIVSGMQEEKNINFSVLIHKIILITQLWYARNELKAINRSCVKLLIDVLICLVITWNLVCRILKSICN